MTPRRCLVSALVLLTLLGLAAQASAAEPKKKAAAKKKADGAKKKAAPAKKKKHAAAKEAGEINLRTFKREVSDLTADQESKISELWQQRDEALAKWDASPQGTQWARAKEEAALGGNRAAAMRVHLLSQERDRVAGVWDAKILAVLNTEQRATWRGFLIYKDVTEAFRRKGAALTASRATEARELCNTAAKKRPTSSVESLRKLVAREIYERLLTPQQKKAVNPDYKEPKKKPAGAAKKKNNKKKNNRKKRKKNNGGGLLGGGLLGGKR